MPSFVDAAVADLSTAGSKNVPIPAGAGAGDFLLCQVVGVNHTISSLHASLSFIATYQETENSADAGANTVFGGYYDGVTTPTYSITLDPTFSRLANIGVIAIADAGEIDEVSQMNTLETITTINLAPCEPGVDGCLIVCCFGGSAQVSTCTYTSPLVERVDEEFSGLNGIGTYEQATAAIFTGEAVASVATQPARTTVVFAPPTFPSTGILDSFTRANEDPLTTNWNGPVFPSLAQLRVVSNQCLPNASAFGGNWWDAVSYGPDCEAYITITTKPDNGDRVFLYARLQNAGTTSLDGYYVLLTPGAGTDTFDLSVMTDGSGTVLDTDTAIEWASGDKMGIRCAGSQLEGWRCPVSTGIWVKILEATDSTYTSAGHLGISADPGSTVLDDLGGGSLVEPTAAIFWVQA